MISERRPPRYPDAAAIHQPCVPSMHCIRTLATGLLASLSLAGCEEPPLPESVEGTLEHAIRGLSADRDPGVLWELLPADYQAGIDGWRVALAAAIPEQDYDKAMALVRRAGAVLKRRSDFLAANMPLKIMLQALGDVSEDDLAATVAASGDVFLILGNSEMRTRAGLAATDTGQFLHVTGTKLLRSAVRAIRITGIDPIASAQAAEVQILSETDAQAQIQVHANGQDMALSLTRVQGRWVPSDLARRWADLDAQVLEAIRGMNLDSSPARQQVMDMVLADLQTLEEIESRTKFERHLMQAFSRYEKLWKTGR